jgi:hypothetical protein
MAASQNAKTKPLISIQPTGSTSEVSSVADLLCCVLRAFVTAVASNAVGLFYAGEVGRRFKGHRVPKDTRSGEHLASRRRPAPNAGRSG